MFILNTMVYLRDKVHCTPYGRQTSARAEDWWANEEQRDTSQAPRNLATERLCKCGRTDESRLGALPPKGRVTFSGDNMGLQWHRKHRLPRHSAVMWPLAILPSLHPALHFLLSADSPRLERCSNCPQPLHSVTGQRTCSKSLVTPN